MPARVFLVDPEPGFVEEASTALQANGYNVASYADSLQAIEGLDKAPELGLLVTRMLFPPGQPNGLSLALMAIHKKLGVRIIFMGPAELQHHATGVGRFLSTPVSVPRLLDEVQSVSAARA